MRVDNFSVIIPEGRERGSEGHVAMVHDTHYTIKLVNHGHRRCDALVKVDGKDMGGFRLDAGCSLTLERPSHDTGRFTFYKNKTVECATATGGKVTKDDMGLIQVLFKPEKKTLQRPVAKSLGREDCLLKDCDEYEETGTSFGFGGGQKQKGRASGQHQNSTDDLKMRNRQLGLDRRERVTSGATGLSGHSDQDFITVSALEYEPNEEVPITLRLICVESAVRELTAAPRGNPVPAPVD